MEVFAYRNLGTRNREEFENMTLSEYSLQTEAFYLRQVDEFEKLHWQAFLNQAVQATTGSKKDPKPKYPTFESFYNSREKEENVRKKFEANYKPAKKTYDKEAVLQARRINDFGKRFRQETRKGGDG